MSDSLLASADTFNASTAARATTTSVKGALRGSAFDLDRLVALCPSCHAQTDAPYARGRLVITPLGGGRFTCDQFVWDEDLGMSMGDPDYPAW